MAKAKPNRKRPAPRRVWVVVDCDGDIASAHWTRADAKSCYQPAAWAYWPYRLISFIEVQPKRKARGK